MQPVNILQIKSDKINPQLLQFIKDFKPFINNNYFLFPTFCSFNAPLTQEHLELINLIQDLLSAGYTHLMILT
jgi:hypothetical protein